MSLRLLPIRITALALAITALAAPVTAQVWMNSMVDEGLLRRSTIDLSRFDFQSEDGVKTAHKRIVSTAYQVCGPLLLTVSSDMRAYRACIAESVDDAVARAEKPALSSLHAALDENARFRVFKSLPADWRVPADG
ncbi:MAG: UrcA family protein [Pseudomonadota bacterium]